MSPVIDDPDHPAAGRGLERLGLELLLHLGHLGLHLLGLLHHVAEVHESSLSVGLIEQFWILQPEVTRFELEQVGFCSHRPPRVRRSR